MFFFVTQLCYADKGIVNIIKVYIERNVLQLEFTFTFAERQVQCNTAHQFGTEINTGSLFARWHQVFMPLISEHKSV